MTYKKLQKHNSPRFCINCTKDQLAFQSQASINQNSHFGTLDTYSILKDIHYIDELNLLLSEIVHKPKIILISESRIRKNKEPY